jgi:hypothetical protein
MDEYGHSRRFQGEGQGAEDGGRKNLAEEFHRLGRHFTLGPESLSFRQPAHSSASGDKTIASATMRESSLFTRNAFRTVSIID